MEFKKPTKYNQRRSKLNVPQRGESKTINSHVARRSTVDETTSSQPQKNAAKTIAIHIDFGPLSKIRLPSKTTTLSQTRRLLFAKKTIFIGVFVLLIIGSFAIWQSKHQYSTTKISNNKSNPNKMIENLEYQTVLPSGESINTLDGWKRVSPPNTDPVYAYVDTIDGIAISVSQQPLPKAFRGNDTGDEIADLAKKFNATTKLNADGTPVYVGTSAKGPQSAILTKNGLLILIKSQEKISDTSWVKYAKSLN